MKPFPPREIVEALRREFPAGTWVALVKMDDPFTKLKPGDQGKVLEVDDAGTIFVVWSNGSHLGIVYGEDACKKV